MKYARSRLKSVTIVIWQLNLVRGIRSSCQKSLGGFLRTTDVRDYMHMNMTETTGRTDGVNLQFHNCNNMSALHQINSA